MRQGKTNKYIDLVVLDYSFSFRGILWEFLAIKRPSVWLEPATYSWRFGCGDIPSGHGRLPSR